MKVVGLVLVSVDTFSHSFQTSSFDHTISLIAMLLA